MSRLIDLLFSHVSLGTGVAAALAWSLSPVAVIIGMMRGRPLR